MTTNKKQSDYADEIIRCNIIICTMIFVSRLRANLHPRVL